MSTSISSNYRQLAPADVERVAQECANAWQDPEIPRRQYNLAVKGELEKWRRGEPVAPFDALVRALRWPHRPLASEPARTLLDVGASGGYYSEVLHWAGWAFHYTACDYSPAFKTLAEELYPGIDFRIADATDLPFDDGAADIVLHGAVLMHLPLDYEKAIQEAVRVASRYIVFHRTPVFSDRATTFYEKDGYDCRMVEVHFNEREILTLFQDAGLNLLHTETVFWNDGERFGHKTYLLAKQSIGEREWERA